MPRALGLDDRSTRASGTAKIAIAKPHSGSPASMPITGQATRAVLATVCRVAANQRPTANRISNATIACVTRFIRYSDRA